MIVLTVIFPDISALIGAKIVEPRQSEEKYIQTCQKLKSIHSICKQKLLLASQGDKLQRLGS